MSILFIVSVAIVFYIIFMYFSGNDENIVSSYRSTGSASAMSSENESGIENWYKNVIGVETGIKTVDDITCCKAMSKECLACKEDITVDEFCQKNSGKYGCCCDDPQKECLACKEDITVEDFCKRPENNGIHGCCCHEDIAECLACKENSEVPEFCAKAENDGKHGCCCHDEEKKTCLACKQDISVSRFCAKDENKGKYGCCCNEPTKECLACQDGLKVINFCHLHPGQYGCCCNREHKECKACQLGISEKEFCEKPENEGKFECPKRLCRDGFFCQRDQGGYTLHAGCDVQECLDITNHPKFYQKNNYSAANGKNINNIWVNMLQRNPVCKAPRHGGAMGGFIGHGGMSLPGTPRHLLTNLKRFFAGTDLENRFGIAMHGGFTGDPEDCGCFRWGTGTKLGGLDFDCPSHRDGQLYGVFACTHASGDKNNCEELARRLNTYSKDQ